MRYDTLSQLCCVVLCVTLQLYMPDYLKNLEAIKEVVNY